MKTLFAVWRRVLRAGAFSPTAFVFRALLIAVFFALSELFGLKQYASFFSGTSANPDVSWQTASILGLIHLLLYVGFILLVPISLLTAGLLAAWRRWGRRSGAVEVPR